MTRRPGEQEFRPEYRYGLGCLIAGAAGIGALGLVVAVALLVELPAWVEGVIAFGVPVGTLLLAWLVVAALSGPKRRGPRRRY